MATQPDTTSAGIAAQQASAPEGRPPLDDAASARQPQVSSSEEDDLFASMVSALRTHIYGKGEGGIMRGLQRAGKDAGRVVGEMVFIMVREVAKQAQEKGARELDYDMLIGVATEAIDDIAELAEAAGITIDQQQREMALLYAQQLYVENQKPTDDQRAAARQDLALMKQDGMVDEATTFVQKTGAENGADPFDVKNMSGGDAPRAGLMGEDDGP